MIDCTAGLPLPTYLSQLHLAEQDGPPARPPPLPLERAYADSWHLEPTTSNSRRQRRRINSNSIKQTVADTQLLFDPFLSPACPAIARRFLPPQTLRSQPPFIQARQKPSKGKKVKTINRFIRHTRAQGPIPQPTPGRSYTAASDLGWFVRLLCSVSKGCIGALHTKHRTWRFIGIATWILS